MKLYYKDRLATIYNCTSFLFKSDVIILDPPLPLMNAAKFEAAVLYIFCGSKAGFYAEQFSDRYRSLVRWTTIIEGSRMGQAASNDCALVIGQVTVPGYSTYHLNPIDERDNKWERPLELMQNLLAESKGDVLDPFMGSGNSLLAAKLMGRKVIGFDTDIKCCEVAAERCRKCE